MIVNQFLVWARTASPSSRADGASALARAYLYSPLDRDQRADAVRALTLLLDDPSPLVRRALAEAFAGAIDAPHHILLALADDQSSIAALVLARSPVLSDAELIDCAATADAAAQAAIAGRAELSTAVAAALAEVAAPEALVALARNASATLPLFSIRRMIERHGDEADLREALLHRTDVPACVRVDLVAATARALAVFVAGRNWMSEERVARVAREAKDRAAIVIADGGALRGASAQLVAHLREVGQLTVGFIFRAILSGKTEVFRAALSDLSGVDAVRVDGLAADYDSAGFAALYRKAGLPGDLLPAFRIALRAIQDVDWTIAHGPNLSRTAIERVLSGCETINGGELDRLLVLLRRFESEAARDEARVAQAERPKRLPPLALFDPHASKPLRLADFKDDPPRPHVAFGRHPTRGSVDLAAIEAERVAA